MPVDGRIEVAKEINFILIVGNQAINVKNFAWRECALWQ